MDSELRTARPAIPQQPATTPLTASSQPSISRWLLAIALFLLTLFSTTTLGATWYLATRTDVVTDLVPILGPETIRRVWTQPVLIALGLAFSLPALLILLCHELGHYITCRAYRLRSTPPYFLPVPIGLGTLGAFIRIRSPIRTKRMLLDVGAAGPLAGFVALLPFLIYGVAHSRPARVALIDADLPGGLQLLLPGNSLLMQLTVRAFHGPLEAGMVLDLHPFALAAWVGLLATGLNLLPLGQLDGGHILHASLGGMPRRLSLLLVGLLAAAGLFWPGWFLWCAIILVFGLRHPPVSEDSEPLDDKRRLVALLCLVIFVLVFMPVPISIVSIAP
jgi:membrane-associated protease RseP (regulator of RpoE activity)